MTTRIHTLVTGAAAVLLTAAALTLAVSCQKDEEYRRDLTFTLVAEDAPDGGKAYVESNYLCWHDGDVLKINNVAETIRVTTPSENNVTATITGVAYNENGYVAAFPASSVVGEMGSGSTGAVTISVPVTQVYDSSLNASREMVQVVPMPMVGRCEAGGSTLKFSNAAALVKVSITDATVQKGLKLYQIILSTSDDASLSGFGSLDENGALVVNSGADSMVTLDCSRRTLPIGEGDDFYLVVAPFSGKHLKVRVLAVDSDNKKYIFTKVSPNTQSVGRNEMGGISISLSNNGVDQDFWGSGSSTNPYLITCYDDLNTLRRKINLNNSDTQSVYNANTVFYLQTADIPLSSWTTAIGNVSDKAFAANYDGGGHSITNLSLAETDAASYGLFGHAGGGNTIKNLTVSGSITSSYKAGYDGIAGLVGESTAELTIERCTTNVSIIDVATGNGINKMGHAGILGCASGATTIRYCKNTGDITEGTGHYIRGMSSGGILGLNNNASTSIEYCENTGNVLQERTTNTNVNYGKIGGICGQTMTNINISNCTNSGTVRNTGASASTAATGGIIGAVFEPVSGEGGTNTATLDNVRITECTNSGTVALTANTTGFCGGIIGSIGGLACSNLVVNVTVSNCTHKNANVTGVYRVGGIVGCTNAKVGSSLSVSGCKTLGGDSYLITGGTASYTSGIVGFTGSFDINLSVSGCANNIPVTGGTYTSGVVSYVSMGSVSTKPVVISNCTNTAAITGISGSTKQNYVGGIVAYANNHPVTVTGRSNSGTITGANYTAGIAAYTYGGNTTTATYITNNTNTGVISSSGNYVAGIVAQATKTTLTGCINSEDATVTGTYHVGGIAGNLSQATTISNCKNFADITATSTNGSSGVGGIIGSNPSTADMRRCLNKGNIYLTYANASQQMYVGGLVGYSNGSIVANDCGSTGDVSVTNGCFAEGGLFGSARTPGYYFKNCYCTGNITGDVTNSKSVGGIVGSAYYTSASRIGYIENCYFSGTIDLGGSRTSAMIGDMFAKNNTTGYYLTITSCYSTNQYGSNTHANYSISQNGDDEYVTSNGDKKLKAALNSWADIGSYSSWVSTDDTELPHLAWEDE